MERPWSLYNKEDKLRIDDLKPAQVRVILLSIPAGKMRHWYACQEGGPHWIPLLEISEFHEDVRAMKASASHDLPTNPGEQKAKDQPARRPMFEDAPTGALDAKTLAIESVQTKERRSARRYKRQIHFTADSKDGVFVSQTVDISMSGLSLVDPLPAHFPKTFKARLEVGTEKAIIMVKRIDDDKLQILEANPWEIIRQWIVNW